jgi:acetyl-CoA carboxylase carboxyltransferase component
MSGETVIVRDQGTIFLGGPPLGHPYYATARLWDDGVIDPAQAGARCGASGL